MKKNIKLLVYLIGLLFVISIQSLVIVYVPKQLSDTIMYFLGGAAIGYIYYKLMKKYYL